MKKIFIFIGVLVLTSGYLTAQPNLQQNREQMIYELRVKVYTKVLELSEDESNLFWPVFNQYQDDLEELKFNQKRAHNKIQRNYTSLTDADFETAIMEELDFEQKQIDLKKAYINKLIKTIPVEKVYRIPRAETQFKKILLEKVKEQRSAPPRR